jgi:hypothetical protein
VSLARDFSFFGRVADDVTPPARRIVQALSDPDPVNRFLAFQNVLDAEKAAIVESLRDGADALIAVSDSVVEMYGAVLLNDALPEGTRGRFLDISSAVSSRPDLGWLVGWLVGWFVGYWC